MILILNKNFFNQSRWKSNIGYRDGNGESIIDGSLTLFRIQILVWMTIDTSRETRLVLFCYNIRIVKILKISFDIWFFLDGVERDQVMSYTRDNEGTESAWSEILDKNWQYCHNKKPNTCKETCEPWVEAMKCREVKMYNKKVPLSIRSKGHFLVLECMLYESFFGSLSVC